MADYALALQCWNRSSFATVSFQIKPLENSGAYCTSLYLQSVGQDTKPLTQWRHRKKLKNSYSFDTREPHVPVRDLEGEIGGRTQSIMRRDYEETKKAKTNCNSIDKQALHSTYYRSSKDPSFGRAVLLTKDSAQ